LIPDVNSCHQASKQHLNDRYCGQCEVMQFSQCKIFQKVNHLKMHSAISESSIWQCWIRFFITYYSCYCNSIICLTERIFSFVLLKLSLLGSELFNRCTAGAYQNMRGVHHYERVHKGASQTFHTKQILFTNTFC